MPPITYTCKKKPHLLLIVSLVFFLSFISSSYATDENFNELINAQKNYQTIKDFFDKTHDANLEAKKELELAKANLATAQNNLKQKQANYAKSQQELNIITKHLNDAGLNVESIWNKTHKLP